MPNTRLTRRTVLRTGGLAATVWRWAGATQATWAARITAASGRDAGAAALRGIVTGDRGDVPAALDRRWRAVGIYHVLSVSGLHLAVPIHALAARSADRLERLARAHS